MTIRISKIGHVNLRVADQERSKRFYTEVLGFQIAEQDPEHGGVFTTLGDDFHTLDFAQHPDPRDAQRPAKGQIGLVHRSEEHTSELQSHSFISYAVFCLKKPSTWRAVPAGRAWPRCHRPPRGGRGGLTFFNDTATTEICTLSLHGALPIYRRRGRPGPVRSSPAAYRCRSPASAWGDRKSTRLNSSHIPLSRMPSSA